MLALRDIGLPLDLDLDALLEAADQAGSVLLLLAFIAVALAAFDLVDRIIAEHRSPVARLLRDQHFGGV